MLIGTMSIIHSAVRTINNDSNCDCIYATNMTQTPHLTKNKQDQEHQEWEVKHAVEVSAMDAEPGEVVSAAGCKMVC